MAIKQHGEIELFSRNGKVFTQFTNLYDVLAAYRPKSFILDGEIVAIDDSGKSNFNALQRAKTKSIDVHFFAFDLLHLNGDSLTISPLCERQEQLWTAFPKGDFFHHSTPIVGELDAIAGKIEELGLEGIIAKRKDSIYTPGKAPGTWIKRKLKQSDEFIIGGYVPGNAGVDAILVGRYSGKDFVYVEDVKDGFIPATRKQVFNALQKLKIDQCSFSNLPEKKRKSRWGGRPWDAERMKEAIWVKPQVVVEIAMNEWTPEKRLRHAEFRRLRPDKDFSKVASLP